MPHVKPICLECITKNTRRTTSWFLNHFNWDNAGGIIIDDNHQIDKAIHLFEKIEDKKIEEQLERLNS